MYLGSLPKGGYVQPSHLCFCKRWGVEKERVEEHQQIHTTNQQHRWKEARLFLWCLIHRRTLAQPSQS